MKKLIYMALIMLISSSVQAESLFQVNVSESVYKVQPKSLFNTICAKTVGDVITVLVDENATVQNDVAFDVKSSSELEDDFTTVLNSLGRHKWFPAYNFPSVDNLGGGTNTKNTASTQKSMRFQDTITTQVVQVLPNGNLVIQGKKVAINSGEKTQVILSGIIDPRFVTNAGSVESKYVANLQLAVVGNGSMSRHESESVINKIFGHLF